MPLKVTETFDLLKSYDLFADENHFKALLKKDPKGVYDLVSKYDLFADYDHFQNSVGIKKKDGGIPFSGVSPTQDQFHSQLPSGGGKQKVYAPPGVSPTDVPKQQGLTGKPWESQMAPSQNPITLYEQTVSGILDLNKKMGGFDVNNTDNPVVKQWTQEKRQMENRRNDLLKTMSPYITKPVDDLIKSGEYKGYFQDDAFDIGKAISYFDTYVKKVGGGSAFRDLLVTTFEQRARETKDAPEINKIKADVYKRNGIDIQGWGKPFMEKQMAPYVAKIDLLDSQIDVAQGKLVTQFSSLANEQTKIFNDKVAVLDARVKSGEITQDQAKTEYGKMLDEYKGIVSKIESNYKSTYGGTLSNMWKKRERMVSEYNTVAGGIDYKALYESLTPEQRKKIQLAEQEAYTIFNTSKNVKKKVQDDAFDKSWTGVLSMPYAGFLGKVLVSGWNLGLASIGDWMIKSGYDNSMSHSLAARRMQGELLAPAQYDWSRGEFMKRIISTTGTSVGMSAPALLPSLAVGVALGPGAGLRTAGGLFNMIAGTVAIGTTSWATERIQNSGSLYRDVLQQTGDVVKATNAANRFEKMAYQELPAFMIGGLADMFLMGTGKVGRKILGFVGEQVEEQSTEIMQSYNEAVVRGYTKSRTEFVKENPKLIYDTFFAKLGQSSIFATAGGLMSSVQKRVPENKNQFLAEAIQRNGVEFATTVLSQYKSMGVINESQFKQGLVDIAEINKMLSTVTGMGYNNDLAKAFISANYQIKALDNAAASEQNPAIKLMYEARSKKLKDAVSNMNEKSTYVVVTLPGGNGATRTLMAEDIYRMEREGTLDEFVLNSDGVTAFNDDKLNDYLKTLKSRLGNPKDAPDGLYINSTTYAPKESTQQGQLAEGGTGQPQGVGQGQQEGGQGAGIQGQGPITVTNAGDSNIGGQGGVAVVTQNAAPFVSSLKTAAQDVETGATMNIDGTQYTGGGLVVPVTSMNTTAEELTPEMVAQFVDQNRGKISGNNFKVGIYKFPNSNKVSIDLNIVVPASSREAALKFTKEADQESLFNLGTFENIKTGATGNNPTTFTDAEFKRIAEELAAGKEVTVFKTRAKKDLRKDLGEDPVTSANKLSEALRSTGVNVVQHNTTAEYNAAVTGIGGQEGTDGVFSGDDGVIHLNMERINEMEDEFARGEGVSGNRIVWHEGSHPVINIIRNTNKPLYDQVVAGLNQLEAENEGIAAAKRFAEGYAPESVEDEFVVETAASIADGTIDLNSIPESTLQKLFDLFNKIAEKLGISGRLYVNDKVAAKRVLGQIADALTTGKDISTVVGKENVKEFMANLDGADVVTSGKFSVQPRVTGDNINVYGVKGVEELPVKTLQEVYDQFGGRAVVINSDPTRVGELVLPSGKSIFMYGGPGYLSIKDNVDSNVGFATTQIGKVNSWSNYIKELFGGNQGVTLVATQAPPSMMSNSYALRYVMDAISQLPKTVLRSSDFKNEFFGKDLVLLENAFGEKAYKEFVSKYKKADLSSSEVIDAMISEMAYKIGDDNRPASFKARRAFVGNLLGGIALKANRKGVSGAAGYVSKKPTKYIASQLFNRLGINAEKLMRDIGVPGLVDVYMNEGKWGMAVSGFEVDPSLATETVQEGGVVHPLFNAKFPGKNPFVLDGGYDVDEMFTPVEMTGPSGAPYTKTASRMLAGSMYVKGAPAQEGKSLEYKPATPVTSSIQESKGKRDLVSEAGKRRMMTEDEDGNYVFFHYSGKKLSKVDPSKFGANTRATGRDERPGIGISMYYTEPDMIETNVPDDYGYVVRIPKDQVYPFNEDPLNLLDEAEKEFRKKSDQAFDFNKQVAWVAKVAAARGYKMTVAEWNIGNKKALRAQTTEALKPELFRERDTRYSNVYKTKPEFQDMKSNRRKKLQESKRSDRDFKLAAFVVRKKQEGMSDVDLKATMTGMLPDVDAIVADPKAWLRTKYPSMSQLAFDNLFAQAENQNIYRPEVRNTSAGVIGGAVGDMIDNREIRRASRTENMKKIVTDFASKYLDPGRGMPGWVVALKDFATGSRDLEVQRAKNIVDKLRKEAGRIGFSDWALFSKALSSLSIAPSRTIPATGGVAMFDPYRAAGGRMFTTPDEMLPAVVPAEIAALPDEIRPFVYQMRGMIDRLTKDLVSSGYVTPEQAEVLEKNIGAYINRAYKMFSEKGYRPSKEAFDNAVRIMAKEKAVDIQAQNPTMSDEEVYKAAIEAAKRDVNDILNKKKNPFFKTGVDSRDTGVLKQRLDIPKHIRELMGEYVDPGIVFMMTIGKQASLRSASYHMSEMRRLGMGTLFFEGNDPNRPSSHSVEIASTGTESKSPLGGLYTTPEVAEALESVDHTYNDLTRAWMQIVGVVRWGKTVGSITTQFKNFESNLGFAVMNGLIYSGRNTKSFVGASKYVGGRMVGKDLNDITETVIRLGLVNSSVNAQELSAMLGSGDINEIAVDMALNPKSKWNKVKGFIGAPVEAANWTYRMGDDFWKVYAYLNERGQLADALYDTDYNSLTDEQKNIIDIESSERVKSTWPTYSRVIEAARYFSMRAPIFGNFISFNAEVMRILPNTIKIGLADIKSDNPKIRAMGMRRIGGVVSYAAFRTAVISAMGSLAGVGMSGFIGMFSNDDDEERRRRAVRTATPPFMRTGDLMIIKGDKPYEFTVVNASSIDPYGVLSSSLNAFSEGREWMYGKTMDPGSGAAVAELAGVFLEPEMTFETVFSAMLNTNIRTGEKIVLANDPDWVSKVSGYVWKNLEPSTVSLYKRLRDKGDYKTEGLAIAGMRPYSINLHESFGFILSRAGKELEEVGRRYTADVFKAKTPEEKNAIEMEAENTKMIIINKLNEIYNDFVFIGADPKVLEEMVNKRSSIKMSGFDKNTKRGIIGGKVNQKDLFKQRK